MQSCEMSRIWRIYSCKIFAGLGKNSERTRTLATLRLFWEDLHNLWNISVYKLAYFDKIVNICSPKLYFLLVLFDVSNKIVAIYALFLG